MKTDKHYISEIDKKLAEFDQSHANTPSQQAEIDKHQRVFDQRDKAILPAVEEINWFD
jgi:hypothetical protein